MYTIKDKNMKIRLTESELRQMISESVKSILKEYDEYAALDWGRRAYAQGTPLNKDWSADNAEYNNRKKQQGNNITQMAIDKMNKQGSGNCITNAAPWQINYTSAAGYQSYITADGMVGIVGKGKKWDYVSVPQELRVKPEDAKLLANWCNRYVQNEQARQYLTNEKFWVAKSM